MVLAYRLYSEYLGTLWPLSYEWIHFGTSIQDPSIWVDLNIGGSRIWKPLEDMNEDGLTLHGRGYRIQKCILNTIGQACSEGRFI